MTGRCEGDDDPALESRLTVPLTLDSPPLPFAAPAPDSPPLAVLDCVVETLLEDRAPTGVVRVGSQAHALGLLHLRVVVLELGVEQVGGAAPARPPALPLAHPAGRVGALVDPWDHLVLVDEVVSSRVLVERRS